MSKVITNVAEIDARIDAAKSLPAAGRAEAAVDLIRELKEATGSRSLNDLGDLGGEIKRLRNRCLIELLNISEAAR